MPSTMQVTTRSERRKARTAGAILDAAERHFLQRGCQAAKIEELADEAGVAVGSGKAAAFLWSAWSGALTLGRDGDDKELRAVLEAGLRIVMGGVASDEARKSEPAIRRLLESTPAPVSAGEPRAQQLRRAPVLGTLRSELPELA